MKDVFKLFIIILVTALICFLIFYKVFINDFKPENYNKIDTTYNTITLDSIEYNIIKKDSIITKIKYTYEDSIIKASQLDDSSSVKLFNRLVSED